MTKFKSKPCIRCGEPTRLLAMGGLVQWRFRWMNLVNEWSYIIRRRWRPWHVKCLKQRLAAYGNLPIWLRMKGIDDE